MNGQFQVAQASGTGISNNASPPRIFKLTKPLTDQSVVINLGYEQKVQVDFSAIANEKITLVHIGEKLIILFDNQSTVTVEPFFDSRHDTLGNLTIEVAPGRDLTVSEFANTFPITTDASVLPAAGTGGNAQASGAHFSDPLVDPLPPIPTNILAPPEVLPPIDFTIVTGPVLPTEPTPPPPPPPVNPVTIVAGIGQPLVVDESFIVFPNAIGSQQPQPPDGSASQEKDFSASFTVNAPAGVKLLTYALTINNDTTNLFDSVSGQQVKLVPNGTGEVDGVVTIQGVQTIVFTLIVDSVTGHVTFTEERGVKEGTPGDFNEVTNLDAHLVSLTATVTDNNNTTATANIDLGPLITIHDDGPIVTVTANLEATAALDETSTTTTAATIDTGGIPKGDDPDVPNTPSAAGGYISHAVSSGPLVTETPTFGADGPLGNDATTATSYKLVVNAQDPSSGLHVTDGAAIDLVDVNGDGSVIVGVVQAGSTFVGQAAFAIQIDSTTGVATVEQYLSLQHPIASDPNDAVFLKDGSLSVQVTITDGDSDPASNSADVSHQISFADDGPTAHADTGNVTEGGLLTVGPSGVLANDVAGADGFAAGGGVVGVRAAGVDLTTAVTVGVNTDIAGLHGTLHLLADGSYTYQSTANNITANATDVFVYTVKDGDGDLSTTTLTINLSDATLVADNQTKTVNEAALDTSTTPPDLGHGTVTGSNPADPGETVTGTLAVAGATGYVAQSVTGTHGLFQLNADGTYTYTLTSPVTESPASNNSTDTVNGVESFSYTAHDANNNTVTGTITINVIDDVPTLGAFVNGTIPNEIGTVNGTFAFNPGADGFEAFTITGPTITGVNYVQTDITSGGHVTGELLTAYTTNVNDPLFTLAVNADGTYAFDLLHPDQSTTQTINLLTLSSGNSNFAETADGSVEFTSNGTVNSSTSGFGVNNQFLNSGESFTMEFHTSSPVPQDDPITFNPRFVDSVAFTNIQDPANNGSLTINYDAYNSATNTHVLGSLVWHDGDAQILIDPAGAFTFDSLTISATGASNAKLRLDTAVIQQLVLPPDQHLDFNVTATDGDGDTTPVSTLDIHISPPDINGNFTLTGGSGADVIATSSHTDTVIGGTGFDIVDYRDDTAGVTVNLTTNTGSGGTAVNDTYSSIEGILGGSGNDTLIGNASANYLNGGAGNDTFKYLATTDSTPAAPDVIADFGHGSDVIDFTAIAGITFDAAFSATTPTTVAAHSIVYFQSGADTHIVANASGGSENVTSADMLLVLTGVNAATLNAAAIHQ